MYHRLLCFSQQEFSGKVAQNTCIKQESSKAMCSNWLFKSTSTRLPHLDHQIHQPPLEPCPYHPRDHPQPLLVPGGGGGGGGGALRYRVGRTRFISRKKGSFLRPPHVRDFVKEGYFWGGGGGGGVRGSDAE